MYSPHVINYYGTSQSSGRSRFSTGQNRKSQPLHRAGTAKAFHPQSPACEPSNFGRAHTGHRGLWAAANATLIAARDFLQLLVGFDVIAQAKPALSSVKM